MSLWEYKDLARETTIQAVQQHKCIFCGGELIELFSDGPTQPRDVNPQSFSRATTETFTATVKRCKKCGWWFARKDVKVKTVTFDVPFGTSFDNYIMGAAGCLKKLDLADIDTPCQEIRDFLVGRYPERFNIHPKKFEDVVASVFRDLGYSALVTNYSGDDGIDVILNNGDNAIGVQVKRYKGSIGVHQIRELAGALLLRGMKKGMFITTSEFQSGADNTAFRFAMKGYPIKLIDGDGFYEALEIAQIKKFSKYDKWIIKESLDNIKVVSDEIQRLSVLTQKNDPVH